MPRERDSQFELLRIVAMMLIVIHHLLITTNYIDYGRGVLRGGEWLNAAAVVGVNCFILISGYYGIRFKVRKLAFIAYSILCVCAADYLLSLLMPDVFNFDYAWRTIVPFSKKANWFIPAYVGLMCVAPVLNRYIEHTTPKERVRMVAMLTLLNTTAFVCSWNSVNSNGYTLVQFIYLYLLANSLRGAGRLNPWVCLLVYALCCAATGAYASFVHGGFQAYAYNNPLVLLASVSLFLCFANLSFRNRWVNRLAPATFTVFLSHYVVLYYAKEVGTGRWPACALSLAGIFVGIFLAAFGLHELISRSFNRIYPSR